jgi:aminoglycoside 3-N-acetyltransferase
VRPTVSRRFGNQVARDFPRASVVDIAPTVLYFLGLPIARDLDGFAGGHLHAQLHAGQADHVHSVTREWGGRGEEQRARAESPGREPAESEDAGGASVEQAGAGAGLQRARRVGRRHRHAARIGAERRGSGGGPDQIHLALRDAGGTDGTLVMYVGCPSYYDDVGRGVLTPEQEREVLDKHPPFDPLTTRSARSHGILAEFFRTYPGTLVNRHVARFAAAGRLAGQLLADHPWDFAYGAGSPLDRFAKADGKILLLGSDHDEVTFLHHVEHVVDFPDKKIARYRVPCADNGNVTWREVEEVNTAGDGAHPNWPDRFFAHLVDGYLEASGNRGGRVGNSTAYLFRASSTVRRRHAVDRARLSCPVSSFSF